MLCGAPARQPPCLSAASTRVCMSRSKGASGSRMPEAYLPILASAHLTGIGFASQNRSRCSDASGASAASAAERSREEAAAITLATAAGATFAVTEITPSPPCSTYSRAMPSSPAEGACGV